MICSLTQDHKLGSLIYGIFVGVLPFLSKESCVRLSVMHFIPTDPTFPVESGFGLLNLWLVAALTRLLTLWPDEGLVLAYLQTCPEVRICLVARQDLFMSRRSRYLTEHSRVLSGWTCLEELIFILCCGCFLPSVFKVHNSAHRCLSFDRKLCRIFAVHQAKHCWSRSRTLRFATALKVTVPLRLDSVSSFLEAVSWSPPSKVWYLSAPLSPILPIAESSALLCALPPLAS